LPKRSGKYMKKGYSRFLKLIHFVGDISLLNFAFITAYVAADISKKLPKFDDHYIFLYIVFNLVWLLIILMLNIYNIQRASTIESIIWNLFRSIFLHALIVFTFIAAINGYYYSRNHLLLTYLIFGGSVFLWRIAFAISLYHYRKKGANFRNVVIVGAGATGNEMYNYFLSDPAHGYRFMGFFDDRPEKCVHKNKVIGNIDFLSTYIKKNKVDEVYCALPLHDGKVIKELVNLADNNFIRFKIVPDFRGFLNKKVNIDFYDMMPVLTIRQEPLESILNRAIKRTFDIFFSLFLIVFVFTWLFPLFIIIIKTSSPGPAFFVQKRSGRRNEVFFCYKFRSMNINDEADSVQATLNDKRITKIGRFLRKTNLDELPQFFNVFKGQMSVVGPRPHMLKHTEEYSKVIDKFMVRHLVKPGITGWAQVSGYRGATQDLRKMLKRIRYDVWYIENWSLLLDIRIIFMTVVNMIKGDKNAV
jgi:putative colanic acid biosynthesis UDP-glucose lipid carrier transferase